MKIVFFFVLYLLFLFLPMWGQEYFELHGPYPKSSHTLALLFNNSISYARYFQLKKMTDPNNISLTESKNGFFISNRLAQKKQFLSINPPLSLYPFLIYLEKKDYLLKKFFYIDNQLDKFWLYVFEPNSTSSYYLLSYDKKANLRHIYQYKEKKIYASYYFLPLNPKTEKEAWDNFIADWPQLDLNFLLPFQHNQWFNLEPKSQIWISLSPFILKEKIRYTYLNEQIKSQEKLLYPQKKTYLLRYQREKDNNLNYLNLDSQDEEDNAALSFVHFFLFNWSQSLQKEYLKNNQDNYLWQYKDPGLLKQYTYHKQNKLQEKRLYDYSEEEDLLEQTLTLTNPPNMLNIKYTNNKIIQMDFYQNELLKKRMTLQYNDLDFIQEKTIATSQQISTTHYLYTQEEVYQETFFINGQIKYRIIYEDGLANFNYFDTWGKNIYQDIQSIKPPNPQKNIYALEGDFLLK